MQVRVGPYSPARFTMPVHAPPAGGRGPQSSDAGGRRVSLSLMLIIGAGSLSASFVRLQRVEPGLCRPERVVASVTLPFRGRFRSKRDGPEWARFFRQVTDRARAGSRRLAAAGVSALPLTGAVEEAARDRWTAKARIRTSAANGICRRGRRLLSRIGHQAHLRARVRVGATSPRRLCVIVNRDSRAAISARRPSTNSCARFFDFSNGAARTIVGVVDNVDYGTLDGTAEPQMYVPQQQMTYPALRHRRSAHAGDPTAALPALKREVKALIHACRDLGRPNTRGCVRASRGPAGGSTWRDRVFAASRSCWRWSACTA